MWILSCAQFLKKARFLKILSVVSQIQRSMKWQIFCPFTDSVSFHRFQGPADYTVTYLNVAASPIDCGKAVEVPETSPWIHSVPHQYSPMPSLGIGGTGPPSPPPPPLDICSTSSFKLSLPTKSSTLVLSGNEVFLNGKSVAFAIETPCAICDT